MARNNISCNSCVLLLPQSRAHKPTKSVDKCSLELSQGPPGAPESALCAPRELREHPRPPKGRFRGPR